MEYGAVVFNRIEAATTRPIGVSARKKQLEKRLEGAPS